MTIPEPILSAFLQVLFDRTATNDFLKLFSGRKYGERLLEKLKITLGALEPLVNDAEDKQLTCRGVEDWLDGLKDALYHADDLVDDIATEDLKRKLKAADKMQISINQVTDVVSTLTSKFIKGIESKLEETINTLQYFVNQKDCLGLKGNNVQRRQLQRQQTTSLVDESGVYGRNDDKKVIINLLLHNEDTSSELMGKKKVTSTEVPVPVPVVIPIVGMGGVGKTTLAQLVYNDHALDHQFEMKAWVCVSHEFDVFMITKKIVEAVYFPEIVDAALSNHINSLDLLQNKLKDILAGKKFLLVLDDVWNDNYNDWDLLRGPFRAGASNSKIIVTTRDENVAKVMCSTVPIHHLKQLSPEDSWVLFENHAFHHGDCTEHPELVEIGKEIVNKCKGLPLAVKSLGGLLRSKLSIKDWEKVLQSEMWLSQSNILPVLILSYNYLPSHLKRCFAYCSIFLKNCTFEKERLVQLWIDEGFVQQHNGNISIEDEGNKYFDELLSRSLFQQLTYTDSEFVMHDLIHDLAQHVSGKFCFRSKDKSNDITKVRHFSYDQTKYDAFEKFNGLNKAKNLRTFISFPCSRGHFLSNKVLHDMLPNLTFLRVLSLHGYQISELPQTIKNLIHLRHLDLSRTALKQLPDSISTLCNLQTLNLFECRNLTELPIGIGKLISLRHLNVRGTELTKLAVDMGELTNLCFLDTKETKLTEMPTQMSKLVGLQHLTHFVVGKESGSRISELRELHHLHGALSILDLQNVTDSRDALDANLKDKKHLERLELEWRGNTHDFEIESDVLENLKPHPNLKHVTIEGFGGKRLPNWLGDSFSNIVHVLLSNCENCDSLPPLGQLSCLKHLYVCGMKNVRSVGGEFYGNPPFEPFQSLETLSFENMAEWEEWHVLGAGSFSSLLQLSLISCPKLTLDLPHHFPCLRTLNISECLLLKYDKVGLLLRHPSSLQKLKISNMPNLKQLPPELQDLYSLEELEISNLPDLTQFPSELEQLRSLRKLIISDTPMLEHLPPGLQHLQLLQELKISIMWKLKELPLELRELEKLESLHIAKCSSLVLTPHFALPPMLKALDILSCGALQSLPDRMIDGCICLERLSISSCSSLVSFPIVVLPSTLTNFEILGCKKLKFPMSQEMNASIEALKICDSCSSLEQLGGFSKLRSLEINGCENLETLSFPEELQNLTQIEIQNCPKMVSFPIGGLPAPNLKSLTLRNCEKLEKLEALPQILPSLQALTIRECPELEFFPDGGLPANIRELTICDCQKLVSSRSQWGLRRLHSLEEFIIKDYHHERESDSFPEKEFLPTSLTTLHIERLSNLKSLNHEGLQDLTSLQTLRIHNCQKLLSLPKKGLPNSLSFLEISGCPKLKNKSKDVTRLLVPAT